MGTALKKFTEQKITEPNISEPVIDYKILSICGGGTKIVYFFGILESIIDMY
jgi:hypothetical protein